MSRNQTMYVCTIRKVSTGYKIASFAGDDLQALRSICTTLMSSPNYNRCYVVCLDWQQNQIFAIQPKVYAAPETGCGYPHLPPRSASIQSPPTSWEHAPASRAIAALPVHTRVVDAELIEDNR